MDNSVDFLDGKAYSVGGFDGGSTVAKGNVYDPDADTWTAIAAMPAAREKPAVAFVDGKLYVTGGGGTKRNPPARPEGYDPAPHSLGTRSPHPPPAAAPCRAGPRRATPPCC